VNGQPCQDWPTAFDDVRRLRTVEALFVLAVQNDVDLLDQMMTDCDHQVGIHRAGPFGSRFAIKASVICIVWASQIFVAGLLRLAGVSRTIPSMKLDRSIIDTSQS
jgi:hypothetical protein